MKTTTIILLSICVLLTGCSLLEPIEGSCIGPIIRPLLPGGVEVSPGSYNDAIWGTIKWAEAATGLDVKGDWLWEFKIRSTPDVDKFGGPAIWHSTWQMWIGGGTKSDGSYKVESFVCCYPSGIYQEKDAQVEAIRGLCAMHGKGEEETRALCIKYAGGW